MHLARIVIIMFSQFWRHNKWWWVARSLNFQINEFIFISSTDEIEWCKVNILNVASSFLHSQAPRRSLCRYLRIHFRNDYRLILSGYRHYPFPPSASLSWDRVRRALGLHPTPIIPAETAQVPRPLRPTSARKISHPGHLPLLCLTAVAINF